MRVEIYTFPDGKFVKGFTDVTHIGEPSFPAT